MSETAQRGQPTLAFGACAPETLEIEKLEAAPEDKDARADAVDGRLRWLIHAHESYDVQSAGRL
jgi:hypothetical protein